MLEMSIAPFSGRLKQQHAHSCVPTAETECRRRDEELAELRSKTQSQEEDDGFEPRVSLESKLPTVFPVRAPSMFVDLC